MNPPESPTAKPATVGRSLSLLHLIVFAALTLAVLVQLVLIVRQSRVERELAVAREQFAHRQHLLAGLRQSVEDQVRMARRFVVTGDEDCARYHDDIVAIREGRKPRPAHYDKVYWDLVLALGRQPPATGEAVSLQSLAAEAEWNDVEQAKWDAANQPLGSLSLLHQVAMNAARGIFRDASGQFSIRGRPDPANAARLLESREHLDVLTRALKPVHDLEILVAQRETAETRRLQESLLSLRQWATAWLVGIILLLAVAFLVIKRRIISPLTELATAAAAVGRNGFFRRVLVTRDDELGMLAGALNRMSETVEAGVEEARSVRGQFDLLWKGSPDALVLSDSTGTVTELNQGAESILGTTRATALGQPLASLLPGIRKPSAGRHEICLSLPDGGERWLEVLHQPGDRSAGPDLACTVLRDVSSDKAEAAASARQSGLQAATLDAIPHPVFVADTGGRLLAVNRSFEQNFGLQREALAGRSLDDLDFVPPAERGRIQEETAELGQALARTSRPLVLSTRDGFERIMTYTAEGFQWADGTVAGLVAVLTDVTAERRAGAELQQLRQELSGLKTEAAKAGALKLQLDRAQSEATALGNALASTRKELEALRGEAAGERSRVGSLQAELDSLRTRLAEAKAAANAAESRAATLEVKIEELGSRPTAGETVPPTGVEDRLSSSGKASEPPTESAEASLPTHAENEPVDSNGRPDTEVDSERNEQSEMKGAVVAEDAGPAPVEVSEAMPPVETGDPKAFVASTASPAVATEDEVAIASPVEAPAPGEPGRKKRASRKRKGKSVDAEVDLFEGQHQAADEAGAPSVRLDPDGLPFVPGLDLRDALSRLELPVEALTELVFRFGESLTENVGGLRSALAVDDAETARRHAHTIAGASGNLSADTLRRLAKTLELALKFEQGDTARMLAELEREAVRLLASIRQLETLTGSDPDEASPTAGAPALARQLSTLLEELAAALDDGELDAIGQAADRLKAMEWPPEIQSELDRLGEQVDALEYGDAARTARSLLERLG